MPPLSACIPTPQGRQSTVNAKVHTEGILNRETVCKKDAPVVRLKTPSRGTMQSLHPPAHPCECGTPPMNDANDDDGNGYVTPYPSTSALHSDSANSSVGWVRRNRISTCFLVPVAVIDIALLVRSAPKGTGNRKGERAGEGSSCTSLF